MALLIILALIGLPLVEIVVFIEVGGAVGLGITLVLTVLTAFAGAFLMRTQGLSTLFRVREALNRGEIPFYAAFDGACQLIAGVLLLLPGFLTDSLGLLLFAPAFRRFLIHRLKQSAYITLVISADGEADAGAGHSYDVDGDFKDVTPSEGPMVSSSHTSKTD